jgi:hypothetical protein
VRQRSKPAFGRPRQPAGILAGRFRQTTNQGFQTITVTHYALPLLLLALTTPTPSTDLEVVPPGLDEALSVPGVDDSSITIDGALDDPGWKRAARMPIPFEAYPGRNVPAPVETECLIAYDRRHLYVAFVARDPTPRRIRAHYTDRDDAFRNDLVGFALDPFLEQRRGVAFMVNPLGVQMDAKIEGLGRVDTPFSLSGSPSEDFSWDAIWESAGRITDRGYQVEIAVPWSALRFPKDGGEQTWGFVAFRSYPRVNKRRLVSAPMDPELSCYLCQAQQITGLSGMTPGRGIEISPTITHTAADRRDPFPTEPLTQTRRDTEIGGFGRWGITPNLSLALAANPDFSQVEADAARVEINRRFTLFFPEKRPFFLEGADRFDTQLPLVYTRSIADPSWGIKLTGKEGPHTIATFVARDGLTNFLLPGSRGSSTASLNRKNDAFVGRYAHDVGQSSSIGVLVTARQADGYDNLTGGVDGIFRLSPTDEVRLQYLLSGTRYPDALFDQLGDDSAQHPRGRFTDDALRVSYNHDARNWEWWGGWEDRGPRFRADLGFLRRVDVKNGWAGIRRNFWSEESSWYNRIRLQLDAHTRDDHDGELVDDHVTFNVRMDGAYQSTVSLSVNRSRDQLEGTVFEQDSLRAFLNVRPTGDFTCSLNVRIGDAIDFANLRPADQLRISPGITWNLGRHLYVQLDHTRETLDVAGGRLFSADVSQGRFVYQFNVRTFLRAIVQRTEIDRDPSLYGEEVDARDDKLFSEYLFSYKVNPRTVLFLGYSNLERATDAVGMTTQGRRLFVKLGYAWVL